MLGFREIAGLRRQRQGDANGDYLGGGRTIFGGRRRMGRSPQRCASREKVDVTVCAVNRVAAGARSDHSRRTAAGPLTVQFTSNDSA